MIILALILIATVLAFAGHSVILARTVRRDGHAPRTTPPRSHPPDMFEPRPWL